MMPIDANELWRNIPPEEKLELMNRAHANGVFTALISVITLCTIAVGLKLPWMVWASVVFSPLVFQLAAGKAWRELRPSAMLTHLAVRSAARRYAFTHKAKDLALVFLVRARVEEVFEEGDMQNALAALEEAIEKNDDSEIWLALFNDAIVGLTERPGGAELKLACLINRRLTVTSNSPEGKEYSNEHELIISFDDGKGGKHTYKISSYYPASLIVFEKKLLNLLTHAKEEVLDIPANDELRDESLMKLFNDDN